MLCASLDHRGFRLSKKEREGRHYTYDKQGCQFSSEADGNARKSEGLKNIGGVYHEFNGC